MRTPVWRSRWYMPLFSAFLGVLMLAAFWIGGDPGQGAVSLGIMTAVGALFLFGSRSDTLQGLGGPGRDERWAMIDLRATAVTGMVLVAIVIGGFLVEAARGEDGSPWSLMGAVGGLTYVASVLYLRRRS